MSLPQQLPGRLPERRRLGDLLVENGLLTRAELREALAEQENPDDGKRRRLGQVVIEKGFLTERQLAVALADLLGLELVDLAAHNLELGVARMLPRQVAERNRMLVIGRTGPTGQGVKVATSDPTNVVALDDVRLYTGATALSLVVCTDSQLRDQLARAWALTDDRAELSVLEDHDDADDAEQRAAADDASQAPTVRLASGIVAEAVRLAASDIHVEPQADGLRIRYRVDGLLRDVMRVPRSAAAALVSRLKIVSGLDIAERRLPQDGRTRLNIDGVFVDARVSTMPSVHGEKVVIRLLASGGRVPPVSKVGLDESQLETLLTGTLAAQGLVLITGPTGSGKTHTLYSVLSHVATSDKNVVTLEDPVEIQLPGITQVQINDRVGLSFSNGLRSVLRQDPDIVLVGEVRDGETAELALRASLTGHLVLTTLHTNDAVAALTRLVDMGVEPFLVASSLTLVVAQRLVRKPCENCAAPYRPSAKVLQLLGLTDDDIRGATPIRGRGCEDCGNTGFRGRTGIFEVLPITASMRAVLLRTPTEAAVRAAARAAGMTTLRAAGLARARRGETTFEEVLRVTQVDVAGGRRCTACDRALADDMVACPWCAATVDRGHCPSCARPLETGWKICPWCRSSAGQPSGDGDHLPSPPRLPRLLIVGDEAGFRDVVAAAVGDEMAVDTAATGDLALSQLWESDYDAVVIQDTLADVAGTELLRTLRSATRTASLPALLVSEIGDPTDRDDVDARLRELVQRAPLAPRDPGVPVAPPTPARERRRSRRQPGK
ncbi:MAG TPA: ATPase, T2SS/T4P/T4SS family [Acidothermaceae bacterium]